MNAENKTFVKRLRRLPDMGSLVIRGETWTKFADFREFRVSPQGTTGDFETDCRTVNFEDLEAAFTEDEVDAQLTK